MIAVVILVLGSVPALAGKSMSATSKKSPTETEETTCTAAAKTCSAPSEENGSDTGGRGDNGSRTNGGGSGGSANGNGNSNGSDKGGKDDKEPLDSTLVETVVVASGAELPRSRVGRHVEVIDGERLRREGIRTLPEALQLVPGVDVRRRGVFGMQADVSIRGGSFEQVKVVVDGVPQNDPQTGHHHMDLPVPVEAIERIEVLFGAGATVWGADALGGVIHIVTRNGSRDAGGDGSGNGPGGASASSGSGKRGAFELITGENSLSGAEGSWTLSDTRLGNHRVSVSRLESGPYSEGNEFDQTVARWDLDRGRLSASLAHSSRDFGAQNFYTTRFPNQAEQTDTFAARVGVRGESRALGQWRGDLSYRRHDDTFVLDRFVPSLLTNVHRAETGRVDLMSSRSIGGHRIDLGLAVIEERLESTNLGDRDRSRERLRVSWTRESGAWEWGVGTAFDHVEDEFETSPTASIQRRWEGGHGFRASVSRSFRVPSYTERFYNDPATAGNPDLDPERAWSYEAGWTFEGERDAVSIDGFFRDASNLIDYVQAPGDLLFRATNLRDVETSGIEAVWRRAIASPGGPLRLAVHGAWLDASGSEPLGISTYVFDYLSWRAGVSVRPAEASRFDWSFQTFWNDRNTQADYVKSDLTLSYAPGAGAWRIWVRADNLFDEAYVERGAVQMPGRWVTGGVRLAWE
ncbi:hypothetical protein ABI59_14205 [Acidobacteria bacterium Mor1]|nr:hypothetical protein ABI59_14205 [Acidobacteria bacterium Mor1]